MTAFGTGTRTASSSAVMTRFSHSTVVVSLRVVSPASQLASGSADRTGCFIVLVDMRALRALVSSTWMISVEVASGMGTFPRPMTLLNPAIGSGFHALAAACGRRHWGAATGTMFQWVPAGA